jgi:selenocysteine lyase/cysteine desulfurase
MSSDETSGSTTGVPRRAFLGLTAALTAACARGASGAAPRLSSAPADPWERVRQEFTLSPDWVHLSGFLFASHPRRVREAIERHRRALDDNPALVMEGEMSDGANERRVRAAAVRYLGGSPEEIALTDSTTMGLATLYNGFTLGSGDEILTTTHDHYVHHESLRLLAARSGAAVRKVPLYENASKATEAAMTEAIASALGPRTRIVAITWVHSSTGVRTPVPAIAAALDRAQRGRDPKDRAVLCVDGVHGFGIEDVTMADLGCDFFVAGCHKWLYGPRGTGLVWGRANAWRALRPTIPPFPNAGLPYIKARQYGAGEVPPIDGAVMSPGGFHSSEHRWALDEAFEMHLEIGKARVAGRIHELNRHLKEGLASMSHVKLHTPVVDGVSAGIVCFEVAGLEPSGVVERLLKSRVIATTTPYHPSYARLASSLVNSHEDVDAALRAVRALA